MEISPGVLDRIETYEILRSPYVGVLLWNVVKYMTTARGIVGVRNEYRN